MLYIVTPVTVKDAPEVAKVQMSAFYPDPHFRALWCQDMLLENKIENISRRQPYALTTGIDVRRHQKVIEAITGDTVGYARWILPKGSESLWLDAQLATPTEEDAVANKALYQQNSATTGHALGVNLEMLKEINPPLAAAREKILEDESYLRLDYIATLPSHQHRGVAGILIEQGLTVAKAAGLKTFAMAVTPAGSMLLKKYGFKLVKTIVQDEAMYDGPKEQTTNFFIR